MPALAPALPRTPSGRTGTWSACQRSTTRSSPRRWVSAGAPGGTAALAAAGCLGGKKNKRLRVALCPRSCRCRCLGAAAQQDVAPGPAVARCAASCYMRAHHLMHPQCTPASKLARRWSAARAARGRGGCTSPTAPCQTTSGSSTHGTRQVAGVQHLPPSLHTKGPLWCMECGAHPWPAGDWKGGRVCATPVCQAVCQPHMDVWSIRWKLGCRHSAGAVPTAGAAPASVRLSAPPASSGTAPRLCRCCRHAVRRGRRGQRHAAARRALQPRHKPVPRHQGGWVTG